MPPDEEEEEQQQHPFAALGKPTVESLARLLYFKHATTSPKTVAACDSWLSLQERQLHALKEVLTPLRRRSMRALLADVFLRGEFTKTIDEGRACEEACLCSAHNDLNAPLMASLMRLVTEEATVHTDRLRIAYRERRRDEEEDKNKNPAIQVWLDSIAQISVLWMGRQRWEDAMGRDLDMRVPPRALHTACVACKLAVVGGSVQLLMDLRTSLVARMLYARDVQGDKTAPEPLLLRMVEAWIDTCYTVRRRRLIRRESEMLAPMVVALRAAMNGADGRGRGIGRRCQQRVRRREMQRECSPQGWPLPLMEADVEEYIESEDDDDEEGEYEDEEGYVAGRWQRRTRRRRRAAARKEGYSQYLPQRLLVPEVLAQLDEGRRRPRDGSPSSIDTTRANLGVVISQTEESGVEPPWATDDYDPPAMVVLDPTPHCPQAAAAAAPLSGESCNADYERFILRSRSPMTREANLASIYDAYASDDLDSLRSSSSPSAVISLKAPSSIFSQSLAAAAVAEIDAEVDATLSPASSEYSSPVDGNSTRPMLGYDRRGNRVVRTATAMYEAPWSAPTPAPGRLRSAIPVPRRNAARRTAAAAAAAAALDDAESVYSVSSTVLMGNGGEKRADRTDVGQCPPGWV